MAGSVPRLFKSEIHAGSFERKILKRVYIESDRAFLLELYRKGEDGRYRRPEQPGREEIVRLKQIARSVKRNRGVVRTGKLSLLLLIVAVVLVFNFLFKNRLLENALENGLESVFGARAEVEGLDFRLLGSRFGFEHLAVADKDEPFHNLFELGRTEIDLDTPQLLKARVVIRNLESRELRFGSERETSGALPQAGGQQAQQPGSAEAERGKGQRLLSGWRALDAAALLEEQLDSLASPGQVTGLSSRLRELQARWSGTVAGSEQDLRGLSAQVEAVGKIKVSSLNTVPELQQAVTQIRDTAAAVRRVQEEVREVGTRIASDYQEMETARADLARSIAADLSYLKSFTDLSGDGLKNLASSLIAGYLESTLGRAYAYALRAKDYAGNLISKRKVKAEKKRAGGGRRRGEDVAFPVTVYPRFLLENMAVSMGSRAAARFTEASVRDISSDPDLTDRPTAFSFSRFDGGRAWSVTGSIDSRSSRRSDLELAFSTDNLPLEISEGLESLNLRSVSARCDFRTDFTLARLAASADGSGRLVLTELALQAGQGGQDPLSRALYETLDRAAEVIVDFSYAVADSGRIRIEAASNIDLELARRLRGQLDQLAAEYEARLRQELSTRLEEELKENDRLYSGFKDLQRAAGGNLTEAGSYQRLLEEKRSEVEKRIAEIQKKAGDSVKTELEKQLDQIKEKIPLPKLGF